LARARHAPARDRRRHRSPQGELAQTARQDCLLRGAGSEGAREDASGCQRPSCETMLWAASLSASAQAGEIRGLLPSDARMALVPAWLSALLASLRNLCAFLAGLVAAWSISRMALVSFAVTPTGRVC